MMDVLKNADAQVKEGVQTLQIKKEQALLSGEVGNASSGKKFKI